MIVIICAKYKKNPFRNVDVTEQTRISKSRPNDLEDIGQGSSHATHPLMLLIVCTKYGKNPSWTVDATERTRDAGRTDGRTEGRTDGVKPIYPPTTLLCGGYNDDQVQRCIKMFELVWYQSFRNHSVYGLSQWEEALHREEVLSCNASANWLSPYPEWSLSLHGLKYKDSRKLACWASFGQVHAKWWLCSLCCHSNLTHLPLGDVTVELS